MNSSFGRQAWIIGLAWLAAGGIPPQATAALSVPAGEKCEGPTGGPSFPTICVSITGQVTWSPDYRVCNEDELPELPALCWLSAGEVTGKSIIPSNGGATACIHGCEDRNSCAWYFVASPEESSDDEALPGQSCTAAVSAGHTGIIEDDCVFVDGSAFNTGLEQIPGAHVMHQISLDCVSPF